MFNPHNLGQLFLVSGLIAFVAILLIALFAGDRLFKKRR